MSDPARHDKEGYISIRRDVHRELLKRSDRLQTLESADETGWLIELPRENDSPRWWDGGAWTTDHLEAVRFARRQDAERVMLKQHYGLGVIALQHVWSAVR
jgi:hypothetical protein